MRKTLLLIPAVLALLVSGCTSYDPGEIVKDSIQKLEGLESYRASYGISISTAGLEMGGEMEIYKEGEKTRADTAISVMGQTTLTSAYQLPEGSYTCTELMGNVTCMMGESQAMMSPEESIALNTEMIDKGIVRLSFSNIASVVGRSCYNITSVFDISKLGELGAEELGGMGMSELTASLGLFTRFDMESCYDFETGMPLQISMLFEIDMGMLPQEGMAVPGKMSISIDMTMTSFEPGAVIEDSVFEIPVEPVTIEVCTDSGTGESMIYQEALAIAMASDCVTEGGLKETHSCNEVTGTWWIDLDLEMEGCSPACVVDVAEGTAKINPRCTGLLPG